MFQHNKAFLKTYERYRDTMDTEILLISKKIGNTQYVYKLKGIPTTSMDLFDEKFGLNLNKSKVTFIRDDLLTLKSIDGTKQFPINQISSEIEIVKFNNYTFTVIDTKVNSFNNLVVLILEKKL